MALKPTVLIIIDGYGVRKEIEGNAVLKAKTPYITSYMEQYPNTVLKPFGAFAGLSKSQAISTEIAYQQIGAGRIVEQQLAVIDKAIKKGDFFRNEKLIEVVKYVKENNSSLHLIGLLSDSGMYSHISHLFALLELAQHHFLDKVFMHIFLDGKDVETNSARKYLRQLDKHLEKNSIGTVATVIGRNYALSKKPEAFKKCYEMLTKGKGTLIRDPMEAVNSAYRRNLSDEFVEPTVINQGGLIKDKDAIIFFNFRGANSEILIKAFTDMKFKKFPTKPYDIKFVPLFGYENETISSAFKISKQENSLSEFLSSKKINQLKVFCEERQAESTFFFNGNNERQFPKEDIKCFNSKKKKGQNPAMSAGQIARYTVNEISKNKYSFLMVSIPHIECLGTKGKFSQAVSAVEAVDNAVGKIVSAVERKKGACIIVSSNGKAEEMEDKFGRPITSHTLNCVPCIITKKGKKIKPGRLIDVAPTVLKLMGLRPPKEFKGKSLL